MSKVLLSGGAEGADILFEQLALKQGYQVRAYSFPGHNTRSSYRIVLNEEELKNALPYIQRASKSINRPIPYNKPYIVKLLSRNVYQIIDTHCVYAISSINFDNDTVNGGTGWAIEIAKYLKKPIYVFDQDRNQWYHWNNGWIKVDEVPNLSTVFTGIGTRNLNEYGRKAIESLFE